MNFCILIVAVFAFSVGSSEGNVFCYNEAECGPSSALWGGSCKTGTQQSPIDIFYKWPLMPPPKEEIVFSPQYKAGTNSAYLVNNGHTVQMSVRPDATSDWTMKVKGQTYKFGQVHCHWESEHTFDKIHYAMECHFVHYNANFPSITAAVGSGQYGALAIFGVLYQKYPYYIPNGALKVFTNNLAQVRGADTINQPKLVNGQFNVYNMLGPLTNGATKISGYTGFIEAFNYVGSLTTPSCNEGMHWFVLKHPQYMALDQWAQFEATIGEDGKLMAGNRRGTQPLNNREPKPVELRFK